MGGVCDLAEGGLAERARERLANTSSSTSSNGEPGPVRRAVASSQERASVLTIVSLRSVGVGPDQILAQLALEELPVGVARDRIVEEPDVLRHLERRQTLADDLPDVVG